MWTAFDYVYRDAGNFKAFGTVILDGQLSPADQREITERLDRGEYFVAEQVGVPPLYEKLYRWSDGVTRSDHCWHEFIRFRTLKLAPDEHSQVIEKEVFIARFSSVFEWDGSLSRHFGLG